MAGLSRPTKLFPNAELKFENFKGKKSLKKGGLQAQTGTEVRGIFYLVTVVVSATAAKAAGLTKAQQDALLDAISLDLRVADGKDKNHLIQDRPLTEIRELQHKAFETEVEGYGAALGKGLSTPLVIGDNEVDFILELPLGYFESCDEGMKLLSAGPEQIATIAVEMKANGDPLNDLDADLVAKGMYVTFAPDERLAPAGGSGRRYSRWMNLPLYRVITGTNADVDVPSLLPIEVLDAAKPNATTLFTKVTVDVGNDYTPNDEVSPADIEAKYERMPDTNAVEAMVADTFTTLYRSWDRPLNDMPTGVLKVTQNEKTTDFDLRAWFVPSKLEWEAWAEMMEHAQRLAAAVGNDSLLVHFVAAPAIHEELRIQDRFYPALGWYACIKGDEPYATIPGLRYSKGMKQPEYHCPPILFAQKFSLWLSALSLNDKDSMEVIVESLTRPVPFGIIGDKGFASGDSWVKQTVRFRFRDTLERSGAQPDGSTSESVQKLLKALDALYA